MECPSVEVTISAASMRQLFHPCSPEFIADVCHAKCCESASAPGGTLIVIHHTEQSAIEAIGGQVEWGVLRSNPATHKCPFKTEADLCRLHGTADKPFGCVASPFTLTKRDTLIVRNRYRMLRCYKAEGAMPAYQAHFISLVRLFGYRQAVDIRARLDSGEGDMTAEMDANIHAMLLDNDWVKKVQKHA